MVCGIRQGAAPMIAAYQDDAGFVGEADPEGPAINVRRGPLPPYITRDMHLRGCAPQMLAALKLVAAVCGDADNWQGETHDMLLAVEAAIAEAERA
jgi:hypothetical protein